MRMSPSTMRSNVRWRSASVPKTASKIILESASHDSWLRSHTARPRFVYSTIGVRSALSVLGCVVVTIPTKRDTSLIWHITTAVLASRSEPA